MKCKLAVDEFVLMRGEINSCHNPLERMSHTRSESKEQSTNKSDGKGFHNGNLPLFLALPNMNFSPDFIYFGTRFLFKKL